MSDLRKLARFLSNLQWKDLPERVVETAKLCVLDLIGVSIGARKDELVKNVASSYKSRTKAEDCSVWGMGEKFPLSTAVMLNAMLAHTLELDDVHTESKCHIGASVIPAAWSTAEYLGRTGKEFLLAVVCGYETAARIGMALDASSHRNKGWHATATCGVFGAAAACAKLLKLDEEQTISALGMAGTQASGLWAFLGDGANCKVLHVGRAASNGLESAFLAKAGMTGPEHILDAKDGGLLAAMSDEYDVSKVSQGLGEKYKILSLDNKPYPCCRSSHCAIDSALNILNKDNIRYEEIERIEIGTYLVGYKQCAVSEGCLNPKIPLDAKFSTPYAVAVAFLYGKVTMKEFEQAIINDSKVQDLLHRVEVKEDERFTKVYPKHWGCEMTVYCKDGKVVKATTKDPSGSVHNPLTTDKVKEKASSIIEEHYPEEKEKILESILQLERANEMPKF
ncbi:MmgE/PrpD family protein [Clostridium magnum]|uniref:2-methylcitrate dehydratase n=1 Tax=Clostridium magnum DSM 2767 TaxID=1121326 RepID=A0A161YJ64_9CLOT|nr:MmgE/PrpD family protein [Clostridium magnum]KZL90452.1 2-methylcitrate dehydratase [Clostridium magnum DSM 2767]SHH85520.1 2-methylcitrate dehydratase PrpD [Clostridium magnum DSM 2767]